MPRFFRAGTTDANEARLIGTVTKRGKVIGVVRQAVPNNVVHEFKDARVSLGTLQTQRAVMAAFSGGACSAAFYLHGQSTP